MVGQGNFSQSQKCQYTVSIKTPFVFFISFNTSIRFVFFSKGRERREENNAKIIYSNLKRGFQAICVLSMLTYPAGRD